MILFSIFNALILLVGTHGFTIPNQECVFKDVIRKHLEENRPKLSESIARLQAWRKSVETPEDLDKQLKLLSLDKNSPMDEKRSFSSIRIRDGGIIGLVKL